MTLLQHVNEPRPWRSFSASSGRISESEVRQKVASVHELKEKLRLESENLRESKSRLRELSQQQAKEKNSSLTEGLQLLADAESYYAAALDERSRQLEEHQNLLSEEAERMRIDVEQERAEVQMRKLQARKYSDEEAFRMAVQCAEMSAERHVVALQIQLLQQEKSTLESHLEETQRRHQTEMHKLQAANFQVSDRQRLINRCAFSLFQRPPFAQTFRDYRETFDRQKYEIEQRFRALLEDAIKDAIFLSSRNEELLQEHKELKAGAFLLQHFTCPITSR